MPKLVAHGLTLEQFERSKNNGLSVGRSKRTQLYELQYPLFWDDRSRPNKILIMQLTAACFVCVILGFLYIGATWNPSARLKNLSVAVLSCDAGVPSSLLQVLPSTPAIGSQIISDSVLNPESAAGALLGWFEFDCVAAAGGSCRAEHAQACRNEMILSVNRGEIWSALFVPADFTSSVLSSAPSFGLQSSQAYIEHIYGSGRSSSTYSFINSVVDPTVSGISVSLGKYILTSSLSSAIEPSFYLQPVVLIKTNLHPILRYGEHFASYLFVVLSWIGSALTVSITIQFKTTAEAAAFAGDTHITTREILKSIGIKSLISVFFSFIQMTALVSIVLCIGNYASTDGHLLWAHNPGLAIAYGSYMSWSFMSTNSFFLHLLGFDRFSVAVTIFSSFLIESTLLHM